MQVMKYFDAGYDILSSKNGYIETDAKLETYAWMSKKSASAECQRKCKSVQHC